MKQSRFVLAAFVVVAAGLSGKRLKSEIGTLSAKEGPLVLRRVAGAWKAEGASEGWKIE